MGSFAGDAKSFDTYTEECSGSMTQKDVLIRKLKNDLEHSRKQQQSTARELRECELSIARLQGQIGKLQDEQALKRSDVVAKDQSLRVLEQQQVGNKVKVGVIKLKNSLLKVLSRRRRARDPANDKLRLWLSAKRLHLDFFQFPYPLYFSRLRSFVHFH